MITPEQLSRYDAYFVRWQVGILYVEALDDNRIEANFVGCCRVYNASLLDDAIIQNLHPLAIFHELINLRSDR